MTHPIENRKPELWKVREESHQVHVLEKCDTKHLDRVESYCVRERRCVELGEKSVQDLIKARVHDRGCDGRLPRILEQPAEALSRNGSDGRASIQVEEPKLVQHAAPLLVACGIGARSDKCRFTVPQRHTSSAKVRLPEALVHQVQRGCPLARGATARCVSER